MNAFMYTPADHIDAEIQTNPQICLIKETAPIHYHDFYEFFLIYKERCNHIINHTKQFLTEGSLVFIRPNDIHFYEAYNDEDCEFMNVACATEAIEDAFQYLGESICSQRLIEPIVLPYTALTLQETDDLISRLRKLKVLTTIDKSFAKITLRSILADTLGRVLMQNGAENHSKMPLWLDALLQQMQRKESFTTGLARMHEISCRSVAHVNKAFKQYLNTTPTEYINRLRVDYTKYLLLTTKLSIVEISLEVGFGNLSHFNHMFKKVYHMTPSSLRVGKT